MILSLKDVMKESFTAYAQNLRESWVLDWPGQVSEWFLYTKSIEELKPTYAIGCNSSQFIILDNRS